MGLLIYKASAGSGKTFRLAVEYIKHLIRNPRAYRQILAVTFTNKATTEMKERILQQLNGIRLGDKASDIYLQQIMEDLQKQPDGKQWTKEQIQKQAGIALQYMIHDYNHFRVETIDSFFQSVMRNLARELEQSPNLNIELNVNEVVSDAVESMMEKLTPTSPLLKWLLDYIEEQIDNNKKWNTTRELKEFAKNIFNEQFIEQGEELRKELKEIDGMRSYIKTLQSIEQEAINEMKEFGKQFFDILEENNLEADLFSYKMNGAPGYFDKLIKGDIKDSIFSQRIQGYAIDAKTWVGQKTKNREAIIQLVERELKPLLNNAERKRKECYYTVISCQKSLKNLHKLQVLNYINEEVRTLNNEKNRFLLTDTNALLHQLIKEEDSSFIFEKLGTQLSHIMIDEFQDTSRMQWDNFRLLLLEGLSQGADSLIVGDVKQSIYRWRNGDWGILNGLGKKEENNISKLNHFPIVIKSLNTNRRSEKKIVDFNNKLFSELIRLLNNRKEEENDYRFTELNNAYSDVHQLSPKTSNEGYVKVIFPQKEEDETLNDTILQSIGNEVERLIKEGVQPEQMAILVRKNKQIAPIANYLYKQLGVVVVSDEAFRLDASAAINLLIESLRYLSDANDKISLFNLAKEYNQQILGKQVDETALRTNPTELLPKAIISERQNLLYMPLYELLEELYRILDLKQIINQESYLFTFFDHLTEYLQREPSDIGQFLQYWDETLCNKTIQSGESKGIRAYTIHKSKGLQFHTVLMPFCNWGLENDRHTNLTWCKPTEAPYNKYSLLPIEYDQSMANSIYQADYRKEQLQLWVDSLNMLYVALTRAEKNLLIWGVERKTNNIDLLIAEALGKVSTEIGGSWDGNEFEYGKIYHQTTNKEKETETINKLVMTSDKLPIQMEGLRHRIEFKQSNESATFIAGVDEQKSWRRFINHGNLMHYIFSKINNRNNVEEILNKLLFDGVINHEMKNELENTIKEAWKNPLISNWYDGSWKLLNERDIIWIENGKVHNRRPDRVMMRKDEVIVVDFKFGEPLKSHHKQVKQYINLLTNMGYNAEKISGYLWYVEKNEVEKVNNLK